MWGAGGLTVLLRNGPCGSGRGIDQLPVNEEESASQPRAQPQPMTLSTVLFCKAVQPPPPPFRGQPPASPPVPRRIRN